MPKTPCEEMTLSILDHIDRSILSILARDARIPMKSLAARVGLSRSAVSERVSRLESNGTIRGYRADIGLLEHDVIHAFLLVTLKATPSISVLDTLAGFSEVRKVSSVSGQLDIIAEVTVASINDLNELRNAIATLPEVHDLTTAIVLRSEFARS